MKANKSGTKTVNWKTRYKVMNEIILHYIINIIIIIF